MRAQPTNRDAEWDVLVFELGGVRHALPVCDAFEVLPALTVVPLPRAPRIVEGVIAVRGALVPVLDVRERFRLPPKPLAVSDHFVLARANGRLVALRVDRAIELARVPSSRIETAASAVPTAELLAGVALLPDGLVLIDDLAAFLTEAEAAELREALAGAAEPMGAPGSADLGGRR